MSAQQRTPKNTAQPLTSKQTSYALALLGTANAQHIHLRDGEVVLYRRSRSLLYQCRYKLADGTWVTIHKVTTWVEKLKKDTTELYEQNQQTNRELTLAKRRIYEMEYGLRVAEKALKNSLALTKEMIDE